MSDPHDGYAGALIAGKDAALDGGRPAPTRQQRRMHVHASQRRHGEHLVWQDAAIGGDAEDIGPGRSEGFEDLGGHALGFDHGDAELLRGNLNR